jgi:hypothetical protein
MCEVVRWVMCGKDWCLLSVDWIVPSKARGKLITVQNGGVAKNEGEDGLTCATKSFTAILPSSQ